jgi:hypothetical protein
MSLENAVTIKLNLNAAPLMLFAKFFEGILQARKTVIDFADFPSELVRVESVVCATCTGELGIVLYPSAAFLVFAATVAIDLDFNIINNSGHGCSPSAQ